MDNCIGVINVTPGVKDYSTLTKTRPEYMLPFASRYRIVDFALSNLAQHDIKKVILYAGKNIRSTFDHVGNGKNWGLDLRHDGLMINPPNYNTEQENTEISTYYESLKFYEDASQENVFICNPMVLTRLDITKAYTDYLENKYDVLLLYRKQEDKDGQYLNAQKIIIDQDGNVENIGKNLGTENIFNFYIENMFIRKDLFIKIVKSSLEKGDARTLIQAITNRKKELKIGTLEVFRHVEYIRDLNSFYKANMNLLNIGIFTDLLSNGNGILTKAKDEPSTLYVEGNRTTNSIVANGCIIEGEVENSIIFRGVKIGKNAIVKNSIIFQKAVIEDGAIVVNSIVDKNAVIREGVFVQGSYNNPYVVEKNKSVERG